MIRKNLIILSILVFFTSVLNSQTIEQPAVDGATLPDLEAESASPDPANSYTMEDVLGDCEVILNTLSDLYVDPEFADKDWEALKEEYQPSVQEAGDAATGYQAIAEMIRSIEAYNSYIVPPWIAQRAEAESSEIELEYAGVGILLQELESGEVMVLSVFSDTPAEKAGVLLGDVLYVSQVFDPFVLKVIPEP